MNSRTSPPRYQKAASQVQFLQAGERKKLPMDTQERGGFLTLSTW